MHLRFRIPFHEGCHDGSSEESDSCSHTTDDGEIGIVCELWELGVVVLENSEGEGEA